MSILVVWISVALALAWQQRQTDELVRDLQESERRFRNVCENMREVFWIDDASFNVVYCSPAYERIWGRSIQDLYAHPDDWIDAVHPEDRDRVANAFHEVPQAGRYSEEFRIIRPDGAVRWVHDRGFVLRNEAGEIEQVAGIAEDITEKKLAEASLREAERLTSLGVMAAGIAHEINNPVGAAWNSAEAALNVLRYSYSPELLRECLENVTASTKRCRDVVQSVLAFAREEPLPKTPTDLADVIERVVRHTAKYAQQRGATVQFEAAESLPLIQANAIQIEAVFENLIRNAIESDQGVTVAIEAAQQDGGAVVTIKDNGRGMTTEEREQVFTPFFSRKKEGGTGLGLFMAHGIIKSHGGSIHVESEPNRGCAFMIRFPAAQAQ